MGSPQAALAEVATRVAKSHDVTAFTSVRHDWPHLCPSVRRVRGLPPFGLVDYLRFVVAHAWPLDGRDSGRSRRFDIVHSTVLSTACSNGDDYFAGDVITSHFCQREAQRLQLEGGYYSPRSRQRTDGWPDRIVRLAYTTVAAIGERLMYSRPGLQAIIAVSEDLKRDLVRHYGCDPKRISVISNGVDTNRFHPGLRREAGSRVRQAHGIRPDQLVVSIVGGDWERKGLRATIEAIGKLPKGQFVLFVIGRGDVGKYARLSRQLGVDQSIRFVGYQPGPEHFLAASDALVCPTAYETFLIAALESLAVGTPALVTSAAPVHALVRDSVNGYLIRRDPVDIAKKLRLLAARSPRQIAAMEFNARASVDSRYTWDAVARRTVELYRQVASA